MDNITVDLSHELDDSPLQLNKEDLVQISEYVRTVVPILRLNAWNIQIGNNCVLDGAIAEASCADGQQTATINFSELFTRISPEEQRNTVVHELLHIHINRLRSSASSIVDSTYRGKTADTINELLIRDEEYLVDALSRVIDPLVPVPHFDFTEFRIYIDSLPKGKKR